MTFLSARFIAASVCTILTLVVPAAPALAQTTGGQTASAPPSKPRPNPYGSPLDTLMSTHLWADVPPAKDFVKTSRPDPAKLEYTPLTGQDPTRPKPRDAAGVAALQAELEKGGVDNDARAKGLRGGASKAKPHAAKAAAKKTTAAR
jgi:hypothetical protein